jgi:hypothetical protein
MQKSERGVGRNMRDERTIKLLCFARVAIEFRKLG